MNPSSPLPAGSFRVLFVCANEAAVCVDARNLRMAGAASIVYRNNAADALAFLEKKREPAQESAGAAGQAYFSPVDAVICEEQLESGPASVFLYALARHPVLRAVPALLLVSGANSAGLYRAAGLCFLERPYAPEQLANALREAMSPPRPPLTPEAFERAQARGLVITARERGRKPSGENAPMTTSDWYEKGVEHLRKKEYDEAGQAFGTVLSRHENHLEACLALARIHQARGNTEGVGNFLLRAAAVCLRQGDTVRAAHIASMLPPTMRGNIFAQEALVRMRQGEYRAAALSFLEAYSAQPEQPLHRLVARACLMTPRPEDCMRKLCEAFERLGHTLAATALRRRLLEYPECRETVNGPSWLDKYPRVKEAVSVASFAARAWRHA